MRYSKNASVDGCKVSQVVSAANAAGNITLGASAGGRYRIYGYCVAITGADVTTSIQIGIAMNGASVWTDGVPIGQLVGNSVFRALTVPIEADAINTAVSISVTAGGTGVITRTSLFYDLV